MRIVKFAALAICCAFPAWGEDYLAVNLGSYHFDRSKPLNETNLGLGYGRMQGYCGGEVGAYWNSHDKLAAYGVGICETKGPVKAGVFLGAASGYQDIPDNYHGVIPIGGLQFTAGPVQLRINAEVAFLQLRFELE